MKKSEQRMHVVTTRRQLLTLMGFGGLCSTCLDPVRLIARSLVDGLIADAQAQSGAPVKKLVSILLPGAPTRWVWDGFLNLQNETLVANASVNNWLGASSYAPAQTAGGYVSQPVSLPGVPTIYLPPLWNQSIPRTPAAGGGTVPMKELLINSLILRGVDMQADLGHVIGPAKALFPIAADASLTGLVGDASDAPLPVVGTRATPWGPNYADPLFQGYKSLKKTSPTIINATTNSLSYALSSFVNSDPTVLAHSPKLNSDAIQNAVKGAMTELGNYTKSSLPGSDGLYKSATRAGNLFQTAFGNLSTQFTTILNKYHALAETCARVAIPNIIPSTGSGSYNLTTGAFSDPFAHQFAVAEYLLVNGYTSAVSMTSDGAVGVANLSTYNDEHDEADRPRSLICQSYFFLMLSAMLYEFRRVLIANNLWNSTLVHISSEYNRFPRPDGTGTDHAPESGVFTMMSGAIQGPILIGNIKSNTIIPQSGGNPPLVLGTYGAAAPVVTDSGTKVITNNIAASTAASILGVQNPVTQAASIVSVNSEGIVTGSLTEAPRNV